MEKYYFSYWISHKSEVRFKSPFAWVSIWKSHFSGLIDLFVKVIDFLLMFHWFVCTLVRPRNLAKFEVRDFYYRKMIVP